MADNKSGRIYYYGDDDIIKKLDKLGVNVVDVLGDALLKSAQKPLQEMHDFIAREHHRTGTTENSIITRIDKEDEKIFVKCGFNLDGNKPGLPALFLNYGTPTQEPTFFIDKAIENNIDEIKRVQQETLEKVAREVGLK